MRNMINNNPDKVICRLINSDYFNYISDNDLELWNPRIQKHKSTCEICIEKYQDKDDIEKLKGFLDSYKETMNDLMDNNSLMGMIFPKAKIKKGFVNPIDKGIDDMKNEIDKIVIKKDTEKLDELKSIGSLIGMMKL